MSRRTPKQYVHALKAEGCRVTAHAGWTEVNRPGPWNPRGVIVHHTGPWSTVAGMLSLLRKGRSDLPGPLCHAGGRPSGVIDLVGWHDTNHAGKGCAKVLDAVIADRPAPHPGRDKVDGNASFYGLELIHSGNSKAPWPERQVEAAVRYCAAICRLHDWTANSVIYHKGWTRRKIDPNGFPNIETFRHRVAERLAHKPGWSPGDDKRTPPKVIVPPPSKPVTPADEYAANTLRYVTAALSGPPPEWISGTPVQREAYALHVAFKSRGLA